jgi:transposase
MLTATQENEEIIERVAALDIGKAELMCCVRVPDEDHPGRRLQEVQAYPALTRSVLRLADHLTRLGVTRVVMEATADYWKPVFYLLEAAGFETWLVNAKDVKHLPGRPKTDLLTELRAGLWQVSGRMGVWVPTVADHDHRRGWAAGSVAAGGAAARVA